MKAVWNSKVYVAPKKVEGYSVEDLSWMIRMFPLTFEMMSEEREAKKTYAAQGVAAQYIVSIIAKQMQDMATVMNNSTVKMHNLLLQLLELKREEFYIWEDEVLAKSEPFLVITCRMPASHERAA